MRLISVGGPERGYEGRRVSRRKLIGRPHAALPVFALLLLGLSGVAGAQVCPGGTFNPLAAYDGDGPSQTIINNNTVMIGSSRLQLTQRGVGRATISSNQITDNHISGDVGVRIGHSGADSLANHIESVYSFRNPSDLTQYRPIMGFSFRLHDIDNDDTVIVDAYDQNDLLISLTPSIYTFDTSDGPTIVSYVQNNRFLSTSSEIGNRRGTVHFNFGGLQVSRMVLKYYDNGGGTYTTAGFVGCSASVTLNKVTLGGSGGPFGFTLTNTGRNTGSTVMTTAANTPTQVDGAVAAGMQAFSITTGGAAVTITESSRPAGWTLTNATCSDATNAVVGSWNPTSGTYTIPAAGTAVGAALTCTFTNARPPSLTLVKTVTNDNGGSQPATAWTLSASGPTNISGVTGSAAVSNATVNPGTYALSESAAPTGYTASAYSCVRNGGAAQIGNSIALVAGDVVTCTINNDDSNAADLSITKTNRLTSVAVGQSFDYEVVVTNQGPAAAHGAVFRDPVAAGLSCTNVGCGNAVNNAVCPTTSIDTLQGQGIVLGTLPATGSLTFTIRCTMTAP